MFGEKFSQGLGVDEKYTETVLFGGRVGPRPRTMSVLYFWLSVFVRLHVHVHIRIHIHISMLPCISPRCCVRMVREAGSEMG